MITDLKALWKEAFGDSDAFMDGFFRVGYSPERSCQVFSRGKLASALYWFDGQADGNKLAYLYGVATVKAMQNQGHCRRLLEKTHKILKKQGYCGAILVPSREDLFGFYKKLGYETCCFVHKFACDANGETISLQQITAQEYAEKRKPLLPQGAFLPDALTMEFLASYAGFWEGENCLLCGSEEKGCFYAQEFFGNSNIAPSVLKYFGLEKGIFRTFGKDIPFAMYQGFDQTPAPNYFGIPLD